MCFPLIVTLYYFKIVEYFILCLLESLCLIWNRSDLSTRKAVWSLTVSTHTHTRFTTYLIQNINLFTRTYSWISLDAFGRSVTEAAPVGAYNTVQHSSQHFARSTTTRCTYLGEWTPWSCGFSYDRTATWRYDYTTVTMPRRHADARRESCVWRGVRRGTKERNTKKNKRPKSVPENMLCAYL